MKRFGSLFLAAVLGSIVTLVSTQWIDKDENGVKVDIHQCAYI